MGFEVGEYVPADGRRPQECKANHSEVEGELLIELAPRCCRPLVPHSPAATVALAAAPGCRDHKQCGLRRCGWNAGGSRPGHESSGVGI